MVFVSSSKVVPYRPSNSKQPTASSEKPSKKSKDHVYFIVMLVGKQSAKREMKYSPSMYGQLKPQVRMGKGKGTFDHWATLVPAGKILFEICAPDLRVEIARDALEAAARAIPGPCQFINRSKLTQPAYVGLSRSSEFHAGFEVKGPIDSKVRSAETPPVVVSKQVGYEKLAKIKKGLVRRK
jgi:Ribosomal protein L16p/L10e